MKPKHEPRYLGEPTLLGQADWLFRQVDKLSVASLQAEFEKLVGNWKRLENQERKYSLGSLTIQTKKFVSTALTR